MVVHEDEQFTNEHGTIEALGEMTVDAWFDYWIKEIKGNNVRVDTIRNYSERFDKNIKEYR